MLNLYRQKMTHERPQDDEMFISAEASRMFRQTDRYGEQESKPT
jgi:hypothetical protein